MEVGLLMDLFTVVFISALEGVALLILFSGLKGLGSRSRIAKEYWETYNRLIDFVWFFLPSPIRQALKGPPTPEQSKRRSIIVFVLLTAFNLVLLLLWVL